MLDNAANPAGWVVYVDEVLLAINKPAGLPALPDGYHPGAPHVKSLLIPLYGPLWIVHRLDRETSGVLALARNAEAHRLLNTQFETRLTEKTYHALVLGNPPWEKLSVDQSLRPNGDRRHRTVVDPIHGKEALTELHVLERFGRYALVEAIPHTGRTHQIRAHLACIGYPIVSDLLYTPVAERRSPIERQAGMPGHLEGLPLARLGLHALSLTLEHPVSRQRLTITAPSPPDFTSALETLRLDSARPR